MSANNSVQIAKREDRDWVNVRVLETSALAKGIYYLDDAVDPSKNVHPQRFGGAIVHADASHVFQIANNGIVRHDAAIFREPPKFGQCYEVEYARGIGRVKGEIKQEQSAKIESRRGMRI